MCEERRYYNVKYLLMNPPKLCGEIERETKSNEDLWKEKRLGTVYNSVEKRREK